MCVSMAPQLIRSRSHSQSQPQKQSKLRKECSLHLFHNGRNIVEEGGFKQWTDPSLHLVKVELCSCRLDKTKRLRLFIFNISSIKSSQLNFFS